MINEDFINTVQVLIEENGRITVAEIDRYFQNVASDPASHETVVEIIRIRLGMGKISAG